MVYFLWKWRSKYFEKHQRECDKSLQYYTAEVVGVSAFLSLAKSRKNLTDLTEISHNADN